MLTFELWESQKDKREKKWSENPFEERMAENSSNLAKETDSKSKKHRVPNKMNLKRLTVRHITIKMWKVKEIILKAARGNKLVTYKGTPISLSLIFQHKLYRPEGPGILKALKGKKQKTYNQEYSPKQDCNSELKGRQRVSWASLVAQLVKNLPAMWGRPGFNPWVGKIP